MAMRLLLTICLSIVAFFFIGQASCFVTKVLGLPDTGKLLLVLAWAIGMIISIDVPVEFHSCDPDWEPTQKKALNISSFMGVILGLSAGLVYDDLVTGLKFMILAGFFVWLPISVVILLWKQEDPVYHKYPY